jgi:ACS family tartrate transporter-like MFS transporter
MDAVDNASQTVVADADVAARAIRRVRRRLIPFLALLYFVAYLDRVNVGFAALHMNAALGLSPLDYGRGAGIFFLGYFLFEVPSNLALARVGARIWIARIAVIWGFVSIATMFVVGPRSFNAIRFLLGAAEAGFFPGIVFYFTYWFPARERARAMAQFSTAPADSTGGNGSFSSRACRPSRSASSHSGIWMMGRSTRSGCRRTNGRGWSRRLQASARTQRCQAHGTSAARC